MNRQQQQANSHQNAMLNTGPKHLNGYRAIQNYLQRIFYGDGKCPIGSMKALLLDSVTTQIVSAVYSQTDILREQIYYVTKLGKSNNSTISASSTSNTNGGFYDNTGSNQPPSHLKAIVLIRPTNDNIDLLVAELQKPIFVEYHIFVTGPLDSGLLKVLADNDRYEKVIQIQEYYVDFIPLHDDLVSFQCRQTVPMSMVAGTSWAPQYAIQYERNLLGIQALLLAFQRRPTVIRYAAASPCAEELAKDLYDTIQADDIYHFRSTSSSLSSRSASSTIPQQTGGLSNTNGGGMLLLIVDRRDDPVTPLLSQWTYQAMVHELLGLNNHRVLLRGAPNISKELEEVVLNVTDDEFFAKHRNSNFGELGEAIQQLLHDYQTTTSAVQQSTSNLSTIEDIQAFMEKYPELRSKSYTVSKHVAIMGELARLVEQCSLMDVSQFEQSLACNDNSHNDHYRELMEKLNSPHIKIPDKLRLGLLYALRYEQSGNLHMIQQAMTKGGVPPDLVNLVPALLRYGGSSQRSPGLFGENHHLVSKMTKTLISTVQGIQNVYSQHVPAIMDTLQSIVRGKLSSKQYPVLAVPPAVSSSLSNSDALASQIPDEIIIFMVGGITYEEGTKINEFNYQQQQIALKRVGTVGSGSNDLIRVVLAGSTVHNSTSFLDELKLSNQAMGGNNGTKLS